MKLIETDNKCNNSSIKKSKNNQFNLFILCIALISSTASQCYYPHITHLSQRFSETKT